MGGLKIGQKSEIVRDVERGIALEAGIGLIEAGIRLIDRRLLVQRQVDAVLLP